MMLAAVLRKNTLLAVCAVFVLPLVIAPLLITVVLSLMSFEPGGWILTTRYFAQVLTGSIYWQAVANTLVISLGATALASAFGVPLGWLYARTDLPGRSLLEQLSQVPIFIPPFVGAVAWILLGAPRLGFLNTLLRSVNLPEVLDVYTRAGMAWVIGLYLVPYVMMIVAGALRSMDPSLEEAGRVCGLSPLATVRRITLPLIAPAILSGAVLAFSICIGLFGTPVVLGWSRQILVLTSRIWIASQAVPPDYGTMAVLAVYLMVISTIAMTIQRRLLGKRAFVTVTGKGFRSRNVALGSWRWPLTGVASLYVLLTVLAPVAILIGAACSTYVWSGRFTTANITGTLGSDDVWVAVYNSVWLSVCSATLATILGTAIAYLSARTRIPGRRILEYIALLPVSVPGIAFGVGVMFLWLYVPVGVYGSAWIIVFAFVGRFTAYAVRAITANLVQVHPELEESARVAGYGWLRTFLRITLPLISQGILAGWILLFSFFMTELSMVILLYTTDTRTLSLLSFEVWNVGDLAQLSGLSLLQLVIGVSITLIARLAATQRAGA
jgi:iron(III) transport system permease protein